MAKRLNASRLLHQRRIPFTALSYDASRFLDAETVADLLEVPASMVYKTLVLEPAGGGKPVLALIAADRRAGPEAPGCAERPAQAASCRARTRRTADRDADWRHQRPGSVSSSLAGLA